MVDLFSTVQVVLKEADFETHLTSFNNLQVVSFEDNAVLGFCCAFNAPNDLLDNWKTTETALLRRFALQIRAAADKAWNVYCVFLCSGTADDIQSRQVRQIEENLERTRKIASCGIAGRDDLVATLLPLLPLQYHAILKTEDATERLRRRIAQISPEAESVVLDESVPPSEVIRLMGGPK